MTDADADGATADPPGDQEAGDGWTLPVEAGWLLTAVAALAPAWGLRGAPGPLYEEGFTVLHAELVVQGQTPGVDFHALYGPPKEANRPSYNSVVVSMCSSSSRS